MWRTLDLLIFRALTALQDDDDLLGIENSEFDKSTTCFDREEVYFNSLDSDILNLSFRSKSFAS